MVNTFLEEKFGLTGRVAVVTGGGGTLGSAMGLGLAKAGANVVISDFNYEAAQKAASYIKENSGQDTFAIQTDITDSKSVEEMKEKVLNRYDKIDILINSAGISGHIPTEEMPDEEWERVIGVNLTGTFFCCRAVGKEMIKNKKGSIINIASMSATIVNKGSNNVHYCSSKGGVVMLTKALAEQWAKYNIRVNAISPGYMRTPLSIKALEDPELKTYLESKTPLQRAGNPEELMGLAIFLASDASSYVTGANMLIDGGYTIL